ncbi:MAG: hypothetical protein JWP37_1601 [Mucilaginibacter sp.]|nr:hypothetical protein [Mucilaginibacter sp.]
MKALLITLIAIHGLIHVLGFVKAFRLAPVSQLSQPISKLNGSLWLLSAIMFVLAAAMLSMEKDWWWILSVAGIMISQYLIINAWQDAKYGTAANIVVLIITAIGFVAWLLNKNRII